MLRQWISCLMILTSALISPRALATQTIEAWSYYSSAPFQTDSTTGAGLNADLVDYLNKALAGKYEIRLVQLPRSRLTMLLDNGDHAVVLFAPSVVFGGPEGGAYLWTAPLVHDRQELISRRDHPFEFENPHSLTGVRFGAMQGHIYPDIAKEMESGEIRADRAYTEASLISMLLARHVDVISLPNSTVRYYMRASPSFRQTAVISRLNLGEYNRHLIFQPTMTKEFEDFNQVIRKMNNDPAWISTLEKYGLEPYHVPDGKKTESPSTKKR